MTAVVIITVRWIGDTVALVQSSDGPDLRLERQAGESDLDFRLRVQSAADRLRDRRTGGGR